MPLKVKFKYCVVCGSKYSAKKSHPTCHCQICKVDFKIHPRCSRCEILIGENHIETCGGTSIVGNGKIICASCKRHEAKYRNEK